MEYFAYSQKEFVYKYVVMLSDIDQFQHMSFANYLKLMFLAADALILSSPDHGFINDNRFRVTKAKMQFKNQTRFGDNILIKVNSSNINQNGFTLLFTYVVENSAALIGLGRQELVCESKRGGESRLIPDGLLTILESIKVDARHMIYSY